MALTLATAGDLNSFLQTTVDSTLATLLLETATAIVQEAAGGQLIAQVLADTATVAGYTDSWLDLPQIPVSNVTSVTLDGTTLTAGATADYQRFGNRLFRRQGWQGYYGWVRWDGWPEATYQYSNSPPLVSWPYQQPSVVSFVYDHGYAAGAQELQLARTAVLSLAATGFTNPAALVSESIDDYHLGYDARTDGGRMQLTPTMRGLIRSRYGRRAGFGRLG